MMSQIPFQPEKIKKEEIEREILRVGIIAELDAISLYEQLAALTKKDSVRKIFLDIAREEKTHVGEFQSLLLKEDLEQAEELVKGDHEVREKTGG